MVFMANVTFSEDMIAKLADLCAKLKPDSRIATLKPFPPRPHLKRYFQMPQRMSWGVHMVIFYRTII